MSKLDTFNPLTAATPSEVHLPEAPLVRVIAQVRFPKIVSIEKDEFIGPFQEAIRKDYPILRNEQIQGLVVGPQGPTAAHKQMIWRFGSTDENWRASLASDFVALETTKYSSREDFLDRFSLIINALNEHIGPSQIDRIGVRYIDCLSGDALGSLSQLVRKELVGVSTAIPTESIHRVLTQALFKHPNRDMRMLARWGLIPKGETIDPNAIEPSNSSSWILDIDAFSTQSRSFDPAESHDLVSELAERIYTFFRWAVTDDFLKFFGDQA